MRRRSVRKSSNEILIKNYAEILQSSDDEKPVEKKCKVAPNLRQHDTDKKKTAVDQKNRFNFLLKKSESFSMFLSMHDDDGKKKHKENEEFDDMDETEKRIFYFEQSPSYIKGGEMRDYQLRGLNWLISLFNNGINGILADEMGLGKTLQTISLLGYMKHYADNPGPHIVICPKSTLANWMNEFTRWCPTIKAISFSGTKEERKDWYNQVVYKGKWDVIVTTYEICIKDKSFLNKISFKYIVIDEAHRIKNEKSKLSEIVRGFKSCNRLLLTGTPLQNNLHELWALLNFLLPDVFSDSDDFDSWFNDEKILGEEKKLIQRLHAILQPFLLRRLKNEVENKLLPKKIAKIYVGLTNQQKQLYRQILLKDIGLLNQSEKFQRSGLMNILMQLRKCCNHPYLFTSIDINSCNSSEYGLKIVESCGKMRVLDKLLPRLQAEGSRVLLFSQMTRLLDILEDYLIFRNYNYCRLDGSTAHEIRTQNIEEFNKPNSSKFIFILSTRAGGLGINLATADIVILYDSDWNPQCDLQAMDRAHRIGQKKQVRVFRFICENTVEERIVHRAEIKLRLDNVVIQQGRLIDQNQKVSDKEIFNMIRHDAETIFASNYENITDEDIDVILAKSESKTAETAKQLQQIDENSLKNFSLDQPEFIYNFEGENFQPKKPTYQPIWIEPPKRERKANYGVDAYYKDVMNDKAAARNNFVKQLKQPVIHDFQFYPKRLNVLLEQESLAYKKSINYQVNAMDSDEEKPSDNEKSFELQYKIDNAVPLTNEEIEEKDLLLTKGFSNWNRKEFNQFLKGVERYGKDDLKSIANDIETKTLSDIEEYNKVFWERINELSDYEKIINQLHKGEAKLNKIREIKDILSKKLTKYEDPWIQLKIHYGTNKGKGYTEEEDRFLICMIHKIGLETDDLYERLKMSIRVCPFFRMDWFLKSRSSTELQRRCNTLLSMIQREMEDKKSKLEAEKNKRADEQDNQKENLSKSRSRSLNTEALAVN